MNQPLTTEELDQIESTTTDPNLTPGPWDLAYEACDCGGDYPCGHGPYVTGVITPVPTAIAAERCKRTGEEPRDYDFHRGEIGDFTEADWVLMVSARQNVATLLAEVRRLREALVREERAHGETIDDRDRIADAADKLAYAAAPIEVIGEHSSMNDPWENALDHVTPAAEVARLRAQLAAVVEVHEKGEHNGLAICLHCASQMFPPPETGVWSESAYPCATLRALGITEDEPAAAAVVPAVPTTTKDGGQ